eukprot:GHVQ01001422.1.p1 GENE.GHVQ01001422.1~~GHVQ01001422.1.p1  ORF type:complete len:447 (-),score=74.33 GHVQ01001422.1:77-1417(-)
MEIMKGLPPTLRPTHTTLLYHTHPTEQRVCSVPYTIQPHPHTNIHTQPPTHTHTHTPNPQYTSYYQQDEYTSTPHYSHNQQNNAQTQTTQYSHNQQNDQIQTPQYSRNQQYNAQIQTPQYLHHHQHNDNTHTLTSSGTNTQLSQSTPNTYTNHPQTHRQTHRNTPHRQRTTRGFSSRPPHHRQRLGEPRHIHLSSAPPTSATTTCRELGNHIGCLRRWANPHHPTPDTLLRAPTSTYPPPLNPSHSPHYFLQYTLDDWHLWYNAGTVRLNAWRRHFQNMVEDQDVLLCRHLLNLVFRERPRPHNTHPTEPCVPPPPSNTHDQTTTTTTVTTVEEDNNSVQEAIIDDDLQVNYVLLMPTHHLPVMPTVQLKDTTVCNLTHNISVHEARYCHNDTHSSFCQPGRPDHESNHLTPLGVLAAILAVLPFVLFTALIMHNIWTSKVMQIYA